MGQISREAGKLVSLFPQTATLFSIPLDLHGEEVNGGLPGVRGVFPGRQ